MFHRTRNPQLILVIVSTTKVLIGIPVVKCALALTGNSFSVFLWNETDAHREVWCHLCFQYHSKQTQTKTIPLILWQLLLNYLNMMKFPSTTKLIRWMCVLIEYRCLTGQKKKKKLEKKLRAPRMGMDFLLLRWCLFFLITLFPRGWFGHSPPTTLLQFLSASGHMQLIEGKKG